MANLAPIIRRSLPWSGWFLSVLLLVGLLVRPEPERNDSALELLRTRIQEARAETREAEDVAARQADEIEYMEEQLRTLNAALEKERRGGTGTKPKPKPAPAPDTALKTFIGDGIQTTRPFSVGSEWELRWNADGELIQIYVYDKESGDLVSLAANQTDCPCKGTSYVPEGGTFYLDINASGSWKVRVVSL